MAIDLKNILNYVSPAPTYLGKLDAGDFRHATVFGLPRINVEDLHEIKAPDRLWPPG